MISQSDADPFAALENLSDLEGGNAPIQHKMVKPPPALYEEPCPKCKGSGKFFSWGGQAIGPCFHCKGKGKMKFRQPKEVRERRKQAIADRKEKARASAAATYAEQHPDVMTWIAGHKDGFSFADAMAEAIAKYGALTAGQEAAVKKCIAKDAERAAAIKDAVANAPEVKIEKIEQAFASASASGLKWPKLRLADFTFSLAGAASKNAGSIYVKAGEEYLGRITDGKLVRSLKCSAAQVSAIEAVCADPEKAAVAYGVMTGACSCCGRELTDPDSVARGIGPICASKYGW